MPPPTPSGRPRWSRAAWEFLENAGLLTGKYEILDGEIIFKKPQDYPHSAAIARLLAYVIRLVGGDPDRFRSQANLTITGNDGEQNRPEPDVLILREPIRRVPTGDDIGLAVEVSDTTQAEDLGFKIGLYARAQIPEYWVLDLPRRRLIAFSNPQDGAYQTRIELSDESAVAPTFQPDHSIPLTDLLPPAEQ